MGSFRVCLQCLRNVPIRVYAVGSRFRVHWLHILGEKLGENGFFVLHLRSYEVIVRFVRSRRYPHWFGDVAQIVL